jgi:hypothetical protein
MHKQGSPFACCHFDQTNGNSADAVTVLSLFEKKTILYKMKLILNNSTEVWIKKTEVLMNSLATKFKSLVLLALVAGLSLQCEKKEEEDTTTLLLASALFSSQGDCTVSAPPRASINTFTTAVTANGTGTISKIGSVPVVGHQTAALKLTAKNTTQVALSGKSFVIVYQSSACPLATSTTTGFTPSNLTASAEFTNSYTLDGSNGSITFDGARDYYIFFYAIPSRGQAANITYTVTNL